MLSFRTRRSWRGGHLIISVQSSHSFCLGTTWIKIYTVRDTDTLVLDSFLRKQHQEKNRLPPLIRQYLIRLRPEGGSGNPKWQELKNDDFATVQM